MQQHLDRAVDLLVEVDGAARRERVAVRAERLGEAGHVVALGFDLLRIAQAEPDGGQPFEVRRRAVGVGTGTAARDEVVDHPAHVALVEHPRRAAHEVGEHAVAERVERADPGREVGRPLLQLELGLLVVGDREHALALEAAVDDEVAEPLA